MWVDIEDKYSLLNYLHKQGRLKESEDFIMHKLGGGVSNKAVLIQLISGDEWVLKQALSKLRVQQDWFCDEERIVIEYKGLEWLSSVLPPQSVPKPVFFDEENHILCMTAIPQPHENLKSMILGGDIQYDLFKKLGELLGKIQNAGRNSHEAASLFGDRRFFEDLRIEPFYQFTALQLPVSEKFYQHLIDQTLRVTETVSHGDYSPKNVLVRNGEVVILDYEVMHLGDPAFDIGFFLCQMLCFFNHVKNSREEIKEAALIFWKTYSESIPEYSTEMESRAVNHTLGCLLARVKGRSPVDFLTEDEQNRQVDVVLELMKENVLEIPGLIEKFCKKV